MNIILWFSECLYRLAIQLYTCIIHLAAFFQPKAKDWVIGRKHLFADLDKAFKEYKPGKAKLVWFHCASLGEFEQGRPLIEKLKSVHPTSKVLLTFFSPSGYRIRKNYALADFVTYLPTDQPSNVNRFLEIVQPDIVVFVKYEFWYYFLKGLKDREIPLFLIAGAFRQDQPFFKWYGGLHRKMLDCFEMLFVQDATSANLLSNVTNRPVKVSGDPRIDRVLHIRQQKNRFPLVAHFCQENNILVAGSTWPEDEKVLLELYSHSCFKKWKLIIAPHDISEERITQIKKHFPDSSCLSDFKVTASVPAVLIIDSIGKLSQLYQYGHIAYIGGGFGAGIHNTLEPMAFNLPVFYGPRFSKFQEARIMVEQKGHFVISDAQKFVEQFEKLKNKRVYEATQSVVVDFMNKNKGATMTIYKSLSAYL